MASGGVAALTRNLMECQTPKIAEALCGVLLLLLDRPSTRTQASVDLHCVAAPYCDFHYRHGWMDKNRLLLLKKRNTTKKKCFNWAFVVGMKGNYVLIVADLPC